jgi:hypothetical protein
LWFVEIFAPFSGVERLQINTTKPLHSKPDSGTCFIICGAVFSASHADCTPKHLRFSLQSASSAFYFRGARVDARARQSA